MASFEYAALHTVNDDELGEQIVFVRPSGDDQLVDHENASTQRIVEALNDLGRDGWDIASMDHRALSAGDKRIFWLRRPKQ